MPLILSGNVASATAAAYDIDFSCRFRYDGDDRMDRTIESPTLGTKWTFSTWIKRDNLSDYHHILTSTDNPGNWDSIRISNSDKFQILLDNESTNLTTSASYRDMSAWYSFIVVYDSTQGTASNRVKLYVNGTQVTDFSTSNYPDQNYVPNFQKSGETLRIGANTWSIGTAHEKLGGYIAETFFIDGVAHAPTDFGEFDSDSPTIWKPKDCSEDFTYGTNGFYLDFADSGDLGDDESGNGNDFAETNLTSIDQCSDSPTNNFATANPLNVNSGGVSTFTEGNTEVTVNGATGMQFGSSSTLGMTSGKWYCEVKIITVDSGMVGVSANVAEDARDDYPPGVQGGAQSVSILVSSGARYIDDGGATHGAATSANGIMMIALDLDNNHVYFGTGGNWFDGSGNADESSPNSAISVTAVGSTTDGAYFFTFGDGGGSSAAKVQWNFGNPPYTNSSSQSDANGYGDFEYSVPSGYLSLCTKNLGSDGG